MQNNHELLWITDLHLDRQSHQQHENLLANIKKSPVVQVLFTGDISIGSRVVEDLEAIARKIPKKKFYFTLGNHDFFQSSIHGVEERVNRLCQENLNLIHLDGNQIIHLSKETCLVGHRGWGDGRAGLGIRSWARNADFWMIKELRGSRYEAFRKIAALGDESAKAFRNILPQALTSCRRVVVATHVPPFRQALRFGDNKCHPACYPHFVNIAAGMVIGGIAKGFSESKIDVLCGHTHTPRTAKILPNLSVEVGSPRQLNTLPIAA